MNAFENKADHLWSIMLAVAVSLFLIGNLNNQTLNFEEIFSSA